MTDNLTNLEKIEQKLDKAAAGAVVISDNLGGVLFQTMAEVMEFAKLMSLAGTAVRPHLRAKPGTCLAVTIQALEWRMSPFSVANKSYEVNDQIAYESQLIHAVIEARAPLKERLRPTYEGEGEDRVCIISGTIKGETEPLQYRSPPLKKAKKKSPLWTEDPDQQLFYYASRAWARRYCPDVLLGIYSDDELRGSEAMRDITPRPDVGERLRGGKNRRGFAPDNVDRALEHKPETALNVISDAKPEPEKVLAGTADQAESQMELGAGDVETEIAARKLALEKIETGRDLNIAVDEATKFLKKHKRNDLITDFLNAANARSKKLKEPA